METIHYLLTDNGLIHNDRRVSRNCDLSGRRIAYSSMSDVIEAGQHLKLRGCLHCLNEGEATRLKG